MQMTEAAFFCNSQATLDQVYAPACRERIRQLCRVNPVTVTAANLEEQLPALGNLEVIFSTWGMLPLGREQLARLPNLKALFYAAGSVKSFAGPFLERGVLVVSGWGANAVPVAEFTCAQILLANKGYFRNVRAAASPRTLAGAFRGAGNYGETVALLGAGMIGKKVCEMLQTYRLKVLVFDAFLSAEYCARLGAEKVSLAEAFRRGLAVSNHLADVPATRGLLRREHFESMRPNAVFINTARGAIVVEADLIAVLRARPDLTALLDVTDPEPPPPDSGFYGLPNVLLSTHIAGSMGDEVVRMADTMIEEFAAWREGRPLRYAVTAKMLETMA
jgi:phosphoglycerate dehydrogenase-like enzyme